MSTLHTVNKSPFEKSSLESCLRMLLPGCGVLLLEDGVYAATRGTRVESAIRGAMRSAKIFCLEPDLLARGLQVDKVLDGIELVSYEGFVELAVQHERVQAWL